MHQQQNSTGKKDYFFAISVDVKQEKKIDDEKFFFYDAT